MFKNKRMKMLCAVGGIAATLFAVASLSSCALNWIFLLSKSSSLPNPRERINQTWDIEIPEEAKLEYCNDGEPSFQGDGERLHVFSFGSEPTEFLADFSSERNEEFEAAANGTIVSLSSQEGYEVPQEYLPDWEEPYYWKYKGKYFNEPSFPNSMAEYLDDLYMMYFPETGWLYVCELLL